MRPLAPWLLLCALVAPPVFAQATPSATPPTREHFAPPGWEGSYHRWHYSPVVKVRDMVIVSGIPAAVGDTYEAKARWMFEQLRAHLQGAGATMADVVELTSFHAEPKTTAEFEAEFARFAPIHHEFFPANYPAWSAVGTTALLAEGAPVELRAVAIIGSGASPRAEIALPARTDDAPAPSTAKAQATPGPDSAAMPLAQCAGPARWAASMAFTHLRNANLLDPARVDHARTRATLLASAKVGPGLYRQVQQVVFVGASGEEVEVITSNEASEEECSAGNVDVFVVSRHLGGDAGATPRP
jgi:enamine deaminase RidA (YjgF/YER057c/UK114 family)